MIDPKFKNVKVGDWIFTIEGGWVKAEHKADGQYPIVSGDDSYTVYGFINCVDKCPSAWTYNPFDKEGKPPCDFKEGAVVMVSNDKKIWRPRLFAGMRKGKYLVVCHIDSTATPWDYARKLTPTERGEVE